jgi:hypothetical protein
MAKRQGVQYGYTMSIEVHQNQHYDRSTYHILHMRIYSKGYETWKPLASYRAQRNPEADSPGMAGWYGGTFHIEVDSYNELDEVNAFFRKLKRAYRRVADTDYAQFGRMSRDLVAALDKVATQGVNDDREHGYTPLAEVKPLEWPRWMAMGSDGNCIMAVIAEDETDAREALRQQAADLVAKPSGWSRERAIQWLEKEEVKRDTYNQAPEEKDTRPAAELLEFDAIDERKAELEKTREQV